MKNTLIWVTVGSISQFVLGMVAALALHRSLKGIRIAAVLVLVPWLLPSVVSANMWRLMLDSRLGVVNEMLSRIGVLDRGHAWFTNPETALYEVLAVELWKNFAFFTLFFLAGLYAIPSEFYEASSVDGSGTLHRFRDITIPMLMPVIVGATILRVIGLFNSPDILLVLTGGGPGKRHANIRFVWIPDRVSTVRLRLCRSIVCAGALLSDGVHRCLCARVRRDQGVSR